jgi:hypothetical protein
MKSAVLRIGILAGNDEGSTPLFLCRYTDAFEYAGDSEIR